MFEMKEHHDEFKKIEKLNFGEHSVGL